MSSKSYTKFTYLSDRELEEMRIQCEQALAHWSQEWLPHSECRITSVANLGIIANCEDETVWISDTAGACVQLENPLLFAAALMAQSDIANISYDRVVKSLLLEAASSLMQNFLIDSEAVTLSTTPPELRTFFGGGFLDVALLVDTIPMNLVASARRFAHYSPIEPPSQDELPIANRMEAIHNATIELDAMLGEVELTIGELNSLQVGDVISLDVPTSSSLPVVNDAQIEICRGVLGEFQGHRALSIVPKK